jgi:S-adenosylmethionine:tRNA ribosyltransferase-isomerase
MNDTRVTAVRVFGAKPSGARVEALLLAETEQGVFDAVAKPGKRLRTSDRVLFEGELWATVEAILPTGGRRFRFDPVPDLRERLAEVGRTPLPPYIRTDLSDRGRYQTVYASRGGSAAAPTAGLHFTRPLLAALEARGVDRAMVTLDVGLDTFRPVESDDLAAHQMHGERCSVPEETAEKIRTCRGRVIAVGTTTVRTLETRAVGPREVAPGSEVSTLFIRPGYRFRAVDGMFTNFHMPRTTMLMMISALSSRENVMKAYDEALAAGYRFLSFGDSMLLL